MKSSAFYDDFPRRLMWFSVRTSSALFFLLLVFCAGCNRDPKKFLAKGNASYDQGKYPEALIYYGRALQLDPRYAEAHFKPAQTQLKLMSWSAAFAELQRTIELQPDNWEAQVDLGRLQLVAGQKQEAKDRVRFRWDRDLSMRVEHESQQRRPRTRHADDERRRSRGGPVARHLGALGAHRIP